MMQWLQRLFRSSPPARSMPRSAIGKEAAPLVLPPAAAQAFLPPAAASPATTAPSPTVALEQQDALNANYTRWLFGAGAGAQPGLDQSALEAEVLDALAKALESNRAADLVRRLPGLIPQLLQSLRSDTFSGADLSRKISNDVVLVAAVIRLANSAFQRSGRSISSVEHAVMVIGQEGLRQLITSVAFRPIIDLHSGHFTRLLAPRIWEQSERCALANRMMAPDLKIAPFEAFLAGLVQNVGLIVALRMMDQVAKGSKQLGSPMFCARLLHTARTLSCSIGQEWNFPPSVTCAIGEQASLHDPACMSPLGQLLATGDYVSKLGILIEQGRLSEDDSGWFEGLWPEALSCYHSLDALKAGLEAPLIS